MLRQSLRRRLVIILLGLTTLSWLIAVTLTAMYSQRIVIRQIDQLLEQHTDLAQHTFHSVRPKLDSEKDLIRQSRLISNEPGLTRLSSYGGQNQRHAANFWFGSKQLVIGEDSPRFPPPQAEGIVTLDVLNGAISNKWRVLYRYDKEADVWIARGVALDSVTELGVVTLWLMTLPLLVLLPVTLLVLMWGIQRGLRPVRSLAKKIAARQPHALDAIDDDEVPVEISPVVDALNELLVRLRRALESETRFTSNAAHELQTPLAAIQAEVQLLQAEAGDVDPQAMLSRLLARVCRASETVKQLLTIARLDADQEFDRQTVDMAELVLDELAEQGGLAMERRIEFSLSGLAEPLPILGNREWLRILVRNLLRNALIHATLASEVTVNLEKTESGVSLSIANDCPALKDQDFDHLTDRFYRVSGNRHEGVGLGLSIVQRIAELHAATLALSPGKQGRGFIARVIFSGSVEHGSHSEKTQFG